MSSADQVRRGLRLRRDILEEEMATLHVELVALTGRHAELKKSNRSRSEGAEQRALGQAIHDVETLMAERRKEHRLVCDRLSQVNGNSIDRLVTHHAMIRYLQRVRGLDLTRLEHEIIEFFGHDGSIDCGLLAGNGFEALVRNRKIISILPVGSEWSDPPSLRVVKGAQA